MREKEGLASQILSGMGADYDKAREEIVKRVGGDIQSPPSGGQARAGRRKTPTLDTYGRDLTELAAQGKLCLLYTSRCV